jgi:hypothetical protein
MTNIATLPERPHDYILMFTDELVEWILEGMFCPSRQGRKMPGLKSIIYLDHLTGGQLD